MGMPVTQLGDHLLECIQHIEVGPRIEVRSGQRGGRMQDEQIADTRSVRMALPEQVLYAISDVNDFPFFRVLIVSFSMALRRFDTCSARCGMTLAVSLV